MGVYKVKENFVLERIYVKMKLLRRFPYKLARTEIMKMS